MNLQNSLIKSIAMFAICLSALAQEKTQAIDATKAQMARPDSISADTNRQANPAPDALPPIVSKSAQGTYEPRANMVRVEGRSIDWPSPRKSKPQTDSLSRRACGGFLIDRTEVTNRDFALFLSAADSNARYYDPRMDVVITEPSHFKARNGREDFPVAYIDWRSAYAFATWAGKTLPTEEEWMIAGMAGRDTKALDSLFPWGSSTPDSSRGNFVRPSGFPGRAAVGSYPQGSTQNGIADLAGNVAEWTVSEERIDVPTGGSHSWMVVKGGSFLDTENNVLLKSRVLRDRSERLGSLGFRCIIRDARQK